MMPTRCRQVSGGEARMPRIDAVNIEEHVRVQTARILDAADRLFARRGYRGTDFEAIAREVGLARNSLYRYYPSKDHVLIACVRRAMEQHAMALRGVEDRFPGPLERIHAWVDGQMETALATHHAAMVLVSEIRHADPALHQEILALHRIPVQVLEAALAPLLVPQQRDPALLATLIDGMVAAAAGRAITRGHRKAVLDELHRAVDRLLQD